MEQLLTTKLYIPPTRPELVPRQRLVERLNQGLNRKLTLISAPAGFGKTTLVSEWVAQLRSRPAYESQNNYRVAWLSLDEGDNDLVRFLAYFIAALNRLEGIEAAVGEDVLPMLHASQPLPTEALLTSLVNDIAAIPDSVILVLDDYHTIESSPVNRALTFLLDRPPPQMHLVIATREDPPFSLVRLRARGQLTELRAADLRFTLYEAAEFLNQVMNLGLSETDITTLESRTEGWIVGLQLAAISMQGHEDPTSLIKAFTGSHRFVLDYLIEEVLERQPEDVQTFLLQTSILDRLTGSLCDALTASDEGQTTLEMLERANLFIVSLDQERRWFRYHRLFGDLLRRQLHQERPDEESGLHRWASTWYEQHGFVDEAIAHALRAKAPERAAHLIERAAEAVWVRGEDAKLRRWLAELPVQLVLAKPQLSIYHAWDLLARGQLDAAHEVLQAVELVPESSPDCAHETALCGRIATARAFSAFYRGDVPAITRYARQALEYLPAWDSAWRSTAVHILGDGYDLAGDMAKAYQSRLEAVEASEAAGNHFQIMIANLKLAIVLRHQGRLQEVIELCRQQKQLADESGMAQTVVGGWLLAIWGEVLAETNDLERALQQAKKGVEITERGGDLAMLGWSYLCLIRILFSRGQYTSAEEVIHKIEHIARDNAVPPWIMNQKIAWQARIWLAQDRLDAVSRWVRTRALNADADPTYLRETEYMVLARFLIVQRQWHDATTRLQRLLEAAEAGGRTSRAIEIRALQALALQAQGDTDPAITTLEDALTLAEPGGFIRIFVDEGPPMARLLYEAGVRGIAPAYVHRLLAAFPVVDDSSATQVSSAQIIEPLSERELEVLHLIVEGLTNKEIASRVFLSLNTVKVHTRHIYGKLGVNNRTQAATRARTLGILPSIDRLDA